MEGQVRDRGRSILFCNLSKCDILECLDFIYIHIDSRNVLCGRYGNQINNRYNVIEPYFKNVIFIIEYTVSMDHSNYLYIMTTIHNNLYCINNATHNRLMVSKI